VATFISEHGLTLTARKEVEPRYDDRDKNHVVLLEEGRRAVRIRMRPNRAPQWAREIALRTLTFSHAPDFKYTQNPDEARGALVCWYDSLEDQQERGWTDEEREDIEARLHEHPEVVEVHPPGAEPLSPPWPAFDRQDAEHIAQKVEEDGYDAGEVLAYERANLARPEVVEALEALR
jgi:hypothetical protein